MVRSWRLGGEEGEKEGEKDLMLFMARAMVMMRNVGPMDVE